MSVCFLVGKLRIIRDEALRHRFGTASSSGDVETLATKFVDDVGSGR